MYLIRGFGQNTGRSSSPADPNSGFTVQPDQDMTQQNLAALYASQMRPSNIGPPAQLPQTTQGGTDYLQLLAMLQQGQGQGRLPGFNFLQGQRYAPGAGVLPATQAAPGFQVQRPIMGSPFDPPWMHLPLDPGMCFPVG
jgi:hypothetical protein